MVFCPGESRHDTQNRRWNLLFSLVSWTTPFCADETKGEKAFQSYAKQVVGGVWKTTRQEMQLVDGKRIDTGKTFQAVHEYRPLARGKFLQLITLLVATLLGCIVNLPAMARWAYRAEVGRLCALVPRPDVDMSVHLESLDRNDNAPSALSSRVIKGMVLYAAGQFGYASPIDAQQLVSQPLEEVLQQSIGRHTQHLADRKMSSHRCHLIWDTRFAYHLLVCWVPPTCSWVAGVPASWGSVREPPAQRPAQSRQAGGLLSGQKQQVESWGAR